MPRRPDMPCAGCGKLMWRGGTSLPAGQARCQACRGACGSLTAYKKGCRCDPCRGAKNASQRRFNASYKARTGTHYARKFDGRYEPQPYVYTEAHRRRDAARRARKAGATVESFSHLEVFERDGWVCGICREPVDRELTYPDPRSPSLDHVIPLVHGGDHSKANARLAHLTCNVRRGAALDEVAA